MAGGTALCLLPARPLERRLPAAGVEAEVAGAPAGGS
jgi:hypothetical protein